MKQQSRKQHRFDRVLFARVQIGTMADDALLDEVADELTSSEVYEQTPQAAAGEVASATKDVDQEEEQPPAGLSKAQVCLDDQQEF